MKKFPHTEFDLTTRAQSTDPLDVEQLAQQLQAHNTRLVTLGQKAPNVGLSTFNIVYRKLRKLNHDYKIMSRTATAAGIGVLAAWVLFRFPLGTYLDSNNENLEKALLEKIQADPNFSLPKNSSILETALKKYSNFFSINEYSNNATWLQRMTIAAKTWVGFPIPESTMSKSILSDRYNGMPVATRGWFTLAEAILGTAGVGLISFATPGIPIFTDYIAPQLKEFAKYFANLSRGNLRQADDYLAGGPVKKVGIISDFEKEVNITLDDVIGNEHAKQEMLRVVAYVTNNEYFDRPGIVPPTGILLEGPTRTGKSFLAEATAGTIQQIDKQMGKHDILHYVEIKAAELIEIGISVFFEEAQKHAPIIIFIDELDTMNLHRLRDSKRFGEMLTAMSMLNRKNKNKVIIMAATNKPEQLDDSLRASGRFGKHLHFVYPTLDERKLFLKKELEKRAIFLEEETIDQLARESEGAPFDALSEMLRTALMDGKIQGKLPTAQDFQNAFAEDINLILADKNPLPKGEQELVAVHQSGHALARILLDASLQLTKVTTRPTGVKIAEEDLLFNGWKDKEEKDEEQKRARTTVIYGNTFTMHKPHRFKFDSYEDLLDELTICLAGHAAEKLLYGNTSYTYHTEDNDQAMTLAKRIVLEGIREKDMPKEVRQRKLAEAHALIEKHKELAYALLEKYKEELAFVALLLVKEELLTAEQIMQIMHFIETEKNKEAQNDAVEPTSSVDQTTKEEVPAPAIA